MRKRSIIQPLIFAQSLSYLVAGTFLLISHYLQRRIELRYLGHIFITWSLISLILTLKVKWSNKAISFDIFSAALNIVTFTALLFAILDELLLRSKSEAYIQSIGESSEISIIIIQYIWIFMFLGVNILIMTRMRLRRLSHLMRGWRQYVRVISLMSAITFFFAGFLSIITQAFKPEYFWGPCISFVAYYYAFA